VHDIAEANILAMESNAANYGVFNVGSGKPIPIKEVAETIAGLYGSSVNPEITGKFRKGDIRHCFADISKIKSGLGFEPKVSFKEGMREIIEWSQGVKAEDRFEKATKELQKKGLV
jgi:dTDP-L-rhamnose 4-epimerase